jgi:hypothetical protein
MIMIVKSDPLTFYHSRFTIYGLYGIMDKRKQRCEKKGMRKTTLNKSARRRNATNFVLYRTYVNG